MQKVANPAGFGQPDFEDGPPDGPRFVFAHGAGAPMDSPFMSSMTSLLAARGIRVCRFEFAYMANRRTGAGKRPPPPMPVLVKEYLDVLSAVYTHPIVIGGKSMGGRVASLLAAAPALNLKLAGLVCLGYPFHPPAKPHLLRTEHLGTLRCPMLVVQGERDPFGRREEVAGYGLGSNISLQWMASGNHDFVPPKRCAVSHQENMQTAAEVIAGFIRSMTDRTCNATTC
jgi:predicted alpha/beta-hydrolase family hydrolase